ncbi:MAG: flagellar assembly protein FliW [Sideroxyarcus sp.]
MMKFTLKRFGGETFEFDEKSVITFPEGLPGFEKCKRFKLIHEVDKPTFFFLQSLDDPAVLFSLGDPALLNISYEVTLSDAEQKLLDSGPGDELALVVIVYTDEKAKFKPAGIKANMFAPIVLNITKRRGLQKVLQVLDAQVAIKGA